MSSAGLAVVRRAHHPDMDIGRVAALSAAITVNLAALVFALRPLAPQIAEVFKSPSPTVVDVIARPPPPPPPPPIVLQALPKPVPVTVPVHIPVVQHAPPPVVSTPPTTEPSHNAVPATPPAVAAPPAIAPGVVSLAYRSSPLRFPAQALRMHVQGTVLLRVLVDENGKPVDVIVDHSSGYSLLDKSAREQVLAGWTFQPAVINGHAVKAWAQVPVSFVLQDL